MLSGNGWMVESHNLMTASLALSSLQKDELVTREEGVYNNHGGRDWDGDLKTNMFAILKGT